MIFFFITWWLAFKSEQTTQFDEVVSNQSLFTFSHACVFGLSWAEEQYLNYEYVTLVVIGFNKHYLGYYL